MRAQIQLILLMPLCSSLCILCFASMIGGTHCHKRRVSFLLSGALLMLKSATISPSSELCV